MIKEACTSGLNTLKQRGYDMNKLAKLNVWVNKSGFSSLKSAQGYLNSGMASMAAGTSCGSSCGAGDDKPKPSKAASCGASDDK
jgi:hypothetical protein